MMAQRQVILFGATGETGKHILDALVEDDLFVRATHPHCQRSRTNAV
jgi:uncharacterized protein YbjT (DUF2867 family)